MALRKIIVKTAAGALDLTWYSSGIVDDSPRVRWSHAARQGLLGGELETVGTVRDAYKIPIGSIIEIYYNETLLVYRGTVESRRKSVDGTSHFYTMESYWAQLKNVAVNERVALGSLVTVDNDGSATGERRVSGKDTPEAIVKWLLDYWIVAATSITYIAGDLAASGITVSEFVIDKNADLYQVIEQLEKLAGGTTRFWAGVGANGKFYFRTVPVAVGNLQATYSIGLDCTAGEQETVGSNVSNSIVLIGGPMTNGANAGHIAKKSFVNAASVAAWGRSAQRRLRIPTLRKEADMLKFANGYFKAYADPTLTVQGMARVHVSAETPPDPSAGQALITDTQMGDIYQDFIQQIDVEFAEEFSYSTVIGAIEETADGNAAGSDYAPALNEDQVADAWIDSLPEVTDSTNPYDDALHESGGAVPYEGQPGTEPGGATGIAAGQVLEFHYPGGALYTTTVADTLRFAVRVANGGTALPASAVLVYYQFRDNAGIQGATGSFILERTGTANNIETWRNIVGGGFTTTVEGRLYVAVKVITVVSPETAIWDPYDITAGTNYLDCPAVRVINPTGVNSASDIIIQLGWAVSGT